MSNKIYILPTTTDNDLLTQSGDSLVTENTVIEVPLLTQDLEGLITQSNENFVVKDEIGEPYFIIWDDEQNLNKNYTPTLNNKERSISISRKIYTPTISEKIYGN